MKRAIPVSLLTVVMLAVPSVARADVAHSGEPLANIPGLLGASARIGTLTHSDVSTNPASEDWSQDAVNCGSQASHTDGAAVYQIPDAPAGTRVKLAVTEDAAAQPLCKVELIRRTVSSSTITDLYDATTRAAHLAASSACPLATNAGSTCTINWTLPAQNTYYVVFWPAGDGTPDDYATFDVAASVLRETVTTIGLSGYYTKVDSCYKVEGGDYLTAKAKVAPSSATGTLRFTLRKKNSSGTYDLVGTYDRSISGGYATKQFRPPLGRYSVRASYIGNLSNAPSSSEARCFDVVARSTSSQKLSGYYTISADYFVYHGGDTITVTATVGPAPAGGSVRFRIEHENYDTSYSYFKHYTRPVVNGKAVLTFSMGYTSRWLPFYRVRSEYLGDSFHFPKKSAWNCIWIRR